MVHSPNQTINRLGVNRLGVEISSTTINAVVVGENEELVAAASTSIVDTEKVVVQLGELVKQLDKDYGGFERLGVAIPGLVDRGLGRVELSTNIPEHSEVDLAKAIQEITKIDVVIENDANAAAYGEYTCGAGRGCRNLFYATLGLGVGGAFIFDGEIWRGASGFAGEFGYVTINSDGMRLEEVASTANIIRRTRSRFQQDSTSSLSKLDAGDISLAAIIAAADDDDDDFAQMMLERTGMYVGTAIAGVINLLNVEKIVVGGEVMQAKHFVLGGIVERAKELAFSPSFDSTSIVEGELGSNAAAIGAALIGSISKFGS